MKEKNYTNSILNVLKNYPNGLRLRSIGAKLGVWHPSLAKDIAELEHNGQIVASSTATWQTWNSITSGNWLKKKNTNLGKGVDNNPLPMI